MTNYGRRRFLGALGAGTVTTAGLARLVAAEEAPVVRMGNDYFDPIGLHVDPGTTVRFEIDAGTHSATAYPNRIPSGAAAFDSGIISEGSFEYTFETPGTYDYYCTPHETVGMVGRIVVGTPGGPAEDSPIPDGDVPDSETIVEQGATAYGSTTDGERNTAGGVMGPGMGSGPRMGSRPGTRSGRTRGWSSGLPFVGGVLGILGVVGGALYWALRQGTASRHADDSAMTTLRRRYARGEIDETEFQQRRERSMDDRED